MNRDNLASLDGLLTLRYGAGDLHGTALLGRRPGRSSTAPARLDRPADALPTLRRVPDQDWV